MTRSLLKQKAKQQLSKNFGALIISGLLLGMIMCLPDWFASFAVILFMPQLLTATDPASFMIAWNQIVVNPTFITLLSISCLVGIIVFLFTPVLNLGVHHVYLKATTDEKPTLSEMFSKMSQFGTAFLTSLLMVIFVILWFLLLIIPGIIAAYSYSMVYFILAENPEMRAMEAIKESKRIMKGHKFDLFVLELSFFWWYLLCFAIFSAAIILLQQALFGWCLLCLVTFCVVMAYVIPYVKMAEANFYNKIKNTQNVC